MIFTSHARFEVLLEGPLAPPPGTLPTAVQGRAFVERAAGFVTDSLRQGAGEDRVVSTLTVNNRWTEVFAMRRRGLMAGAFVRLKWKPEKPKELAGWVGPSSHVEWIGSWAGLALGFVAAGYATIKGLPADLKPGLKLGLTLLAGTGGGLALMFAVARSGLLRASAQADALVESVVAALHANAKALGVTLRLTSTTGPALSSGASGLRRE